MNEKLPRNFQKEFRGSFTYSKQIYIAVHIPMNNAQMGRVPSPSRLRRATILNGMLAPGKH